MGTMVTMKPRPQQYQSGTEFIHAWKKFAKGEEIPPPTNINGDPAMLWELYSEIQQAAAITIAQQNLGGTPTDNAIRSFLSDMHTYGCRVCGDWRDLIMQQAVALLFQLEPDLPIDQQKPLINAMILAEIKRCGLKKPRFQRLSFNYERAYHLSARIAATLYDQEVAVSARFRLGTIYVPYKCRNASTTACFSFQEFAELQSLCPRGPAQLLAIQTLHNSYRSYFDKVEYLTGESMELLDLLDTRWADGHRDGRF